MIEVRPEFAVTPEGEPGVERYSGIEPRPLQPFDRIIGSTPISGTDIAAINTFYREEEASMQASPPHVLTDADLEYCALTKPPEQALRATMEEIRRLAMAHPFVTGAQAGTNNEAVFKAWLGSGKWEGGTFREGMTIGAARFAGATLLGEALLLNIRDEAGEGPNISWKEHGSHSDDFMEVGDGTIGRKETLRAIARAGKRPGVRLAGELIITMGTNGNPLEVGANAATNEGLTDITYNAADKTGQSLSHNVPRQFLEIHSAVDVDHYEKMIAATVAEIEREPNRMLENTIVALMSMRTSWFVGMKPWMNEVVRAGWQQGSGSIDLAQTLNPLHFPGPQEVSLPLPTGRLILAAGIDKRRPGTVPLP